MKPLKQPVSVLVVLHDGGGNVLLLERADKPGYWQSVTGSIEPGETLMQAAMREVWEETGLALSQGGVVDWQFSVVYDIYAHWLHRYPQGTTRNTEHLFSAAIPPYSPIKLSAEHTDFLWLPAGEAAGKVFSPSNREAVLRFVRP
ncbi:MAG: dihydroneopterin triphosphate diphosphatase [Neisseria sp.]|nr:dihydroneopterin triphosphate diphosphatase [Neisseria sp.]